MNGSVCIEPRPDHDPSVRQTTVGVRAAGFSSHDAQKRLKSAMPPRASVDHRGTRDAGFWIRQSIR
jgi:hypothetical protein